MRSLALSASVIFLLLASSGSAGARGLGEWIRARLPAGRDLRVPEPQAEALRRVTVAVRAREPGALRWLSEDLARVSASGRISAGSPLARAIDTGLELASRPLYRPSFDLTAVADLQRISQAILERPGVTLDARTQTAVRLRLERAGHLVEGEVRKILEETQQLIRLGTLASSPQLDWTRDLLRGSDVDSLVGQRMVERERRNARTALEMAANGVAYLRRQVEHLDWLALPGGQPGLARPRLEARLEEASLELTRARAQLRPAAQLVR